MQASRAPRSRLCKRVLALHRLLCWLCTCRLHRLHASSVPVRPGLLLLQPRTSPTPEPHPQADAVWGAQHSKPWLMPLGRRHHCGRDSAWHGRQCAGAHLEPCCWHHCRRHRARPHVCRRRGRRPGCCCRQPCPRSYSCRHHDGRRHPSAAAAVWQGCLQEAPPLPAQAAPHPLQADLWPQVRARIPRKLPAHVSAR